MTALHFACNPSRSRPLFLLAAAWMVLAAPVMLAQRASISPCDPDPTGATATPAIPTLVYDVASIRPHAADDGSMSIRDAAHEAKFSVTGITIKDVIEDAYNLRGDFQVSGGPSWLDSEHFDIQARSDSATNGQLTKLSNCEARHEKQLMLQALLADRLKLTIHRGTKEVAGYDLVIAKNGPKLRESKPVPASDDATPAENRAYGGMTMRMAKLGYDASFQQYSAPLIASWLSSNLHGPIRDKTGLTAVYDFKLQYSSDEDRTTASGSDAPWPSIFTAIQEQLGLKLQPAKIPVETITIDHIDPPSEN